MAASVPIQHFRSLIQLTELPLADVKDELVSLGIEPGLLDPTGKATSVPADIYGRVFIHLIKNMQPTLQKPGDNLQGILSFSTYRMMYEAMLNAATLGEALERASIYFQRFQPAGATFHVSISADSAIWSFDLGQADDSTDNTVSTTNFCMGELNWLPGTSGNVLALSTWHRTASWYIGHYIDIDRVEVRAQSEGDKTYDSLFKTAIHFGGERNALSFSKRYLDFPIVKSESSLNDMLASFPAELLNLDELDNSVSSQILGLLGTDFRNELPTLPDIARRLNTTTATLHRRLKSEGKNWQKIKDDARRDAAAAHLCNPDYSISDVAELMGFSDDSTFYRSFKKWTRQTPKQYRDGLS